MSKEFNIPCLKAVAEAEQANQTLDIAFENADKACLGDISSLSKGDQERVNSTFKLLSELKGLKPSGGFLEKLDPSIGIAELQIKLNALIKEAIEYSMVGDEEKDSKINACHACARKRTDDNWKKSMAEGAKVGINGVQS